MQVYFKRINSMLIVLLVFLLITGCTSKSPSPAPESPKVKENASYPLTLTDQMDREVVIEKMPERIVSLAPSNTEIFFALGMGEKVVGVTDYCDSPETAKDKEKIGGFSNPNLEKIISLKPDLVLATSMHEKPVEELEKLNIPSVVLAPKDFDDMFESIEITGKAVGCEIEALTLVETLKTRVKDVEDKISGIPDNERPKVYYELWPSPITSVGPGTFVDSIIQLAGGENIAGDAKKAYQEYSQEMIIDKNPDIIIFSHHGSSKQSAEDILQRPGWQDIKAIKNGKVFYIEENLVQRATPRLVDGLEQLAKIIHPELF